MLRGLFTRNTAKVRPQDVLLGCLLSFAENGQDEVSLSEIFDATRSLQDPLKLSYDFSEDFLYSGTGVVPWAETNS